MPLTLRAASAVVASAALLLAAACGGDEDDSPPTPTAPPATPAVTVLGIWAGEELASFEAMVAGWDGAMDFTGTRDLTEVLQARVDAGNAPDIALPAEVGSLARYAREGKIVPLSACPGLEELVRGKYPQAYIDLGTVDGVLYGFFMKADSKATIFYNPSVFEQRKLTPPGADANFADLLALSQTIRDGGLAPWSMGQEAGGSSGFPGSDTIQQILLNEAGPAVYDALVAGDMAFTDAEVKGAWEQFAALALGPGFVAQGGGAAISATNFQQSVAPLYEDPPTAALVHLGGFASGFIAEQFPEAVPSEDFDFFSWPGGGVTGGANVAYAFNSDPETCSFLTHIAGAEAQEVWVERGGFVSLNTDVSLDAYPDPVARRQAEQLTSASVFRFDLDDAIGGDVQRAIFDGVLAYLANPADLDAILQRIEAARE